MPAFGFLGEHVQSFRVGNDNTIRNYNLSLLEDNLMNALGFYQTVPPQNLFLEDVNDLLEQALAVVLWRASEQLAITAASNVTFQEDVTVVLWYQIQINKYTPFMGFVLSLVMLIIVLIITPQTAHGPQELQSLSGAGILQLSWLLGKITSISERMGNNVRKPTTKALRKEGLTITVKMSEAVEEHLAANEVPTTPGLDKDFGS
ncbi:hypothetical protein EW026_g5558 [Hermanssonia centrifuga]|uniref:Uncharacterized protein n=1 Tax=Hermanssonia centrifuga TaxID=98765 RepID=A0A4S4KDQ1_9APHY|nr:hypothetical protein EW026_g5558 [Hermanssonia centrifuga]